MQVNIIIAETDEDDIGMMNWTKNKKSNYCIGWLKNRDDWGWEPPFPNGNVGKTSQKAITTLSLRDRELKEKGTMYTRIEKRRREGWGFGIRGRGRGRGWRMRMRRMERRRRRQLRSPMDGMYTVPMSQPVRPGKGWWLDYDDMRWRWS